MTTILLHIVQLTSNEDHSSTGRYACGASQFRGQIRLLCLTVPRAGMLAVPHTAYCLIYFPLRKQEDGATQS